MNSLLVVARYFSETGGVTLENMAGVLAHAS